jgi:hypothetical protein
MNQEKREEFISAFLDGELSPTEEAQVRKRMESDPATRHLYEDFLALRKKFRQLPRQTLSEDFSDSVLAKARERKMQRASGERDGIPQLGSMHQRGEGRLTDSPSLLQRLSRPRTLLWPGLALSVAFLFMAFQSDFGLFNNGDHLAIQTPSTNSQNKNARTGPASPPDMVANSAKEETSSDGEIMPPPMALEIGPSAEDLEELGPYLIAPPEKVTFHEIEVTMDPVALRRKKMSQILAAEMVSWTKTSDSTDGATVLETELSPIVLERILESIAAEPKAFVGLDVTPALELLLQQNASTRSTDTAGEAPETALDQEDPSSEKEKIRVRFRLHSGRKGNLPEQAPKPNPS